MRHVAIDAFTAGLFEGIGLISEQIKILRYAIGVIAVDFVVAMSDRVHHRCIGITPIMATDAKPVAGKERFGRVRIVAVHAVNAASSHAAAEEGAKLIILL